MLDRLSPLGRSVAATALAVLPVVAAASRAAATDWVPIGDNAYFTLRSLDVGTEHHPLVGAWSSGSTDLGRDVNNLGPIQLDLLAPFTRLAPYAGTAIGVATVHIAAVIAIAWVVRRVGGDRLVPAAMVPVALMTWVMGSEMLITPRQHQFLLIPFALVLASAWAATSGDRWAIVPFVVAGSLTVQTHLSYPILVAALAVPVALGQVGAFRAAEDRAAWRRPLIVTAVVTAVLWSQTAIDQFAGWGNLRSVLSSPGDAEPPGLGTGLRLVADVVAGRVAYARPGYAVFDANAGGGTEVQVAMLVLVIAGLAGGLAWSIRRTGPGPITAWFAVALTALLAGVVNASQLPVTIFGLPSFNYRWLWPIAALLVGGAVALAASLSDRRLPPVVSASCLAFVLVGLTALNLPEAIERPDAAQHREWRRVVAEMSDQLVDVPLDGPVVIDQSRVIFGHPFAFPVGTVLRDRGIEYRYEGEENGRRFGESRVATGLEPTRLVILYGDEAALAWNDPGVVVSVSGELPFVLLRVVSP